MTPTSSRRPNTSVTPKTKPSILRIKLSEFIKTSQAKAVTKAGQFIAFKPLATGPASAPIALPIAIKGMAGIKEAISPNKTVRTTTGFPQKRWVIKRSNFPSLRLWLFDTSEPSSNSSIQSNFAWPVSKTPLFVLSEAKRFFSASSNFCLFSPVKAALTFAATGKSPSTTFAESHAAE